VLATYHTDIPLPSCFSEDPSSTARVNRNPYAADPLTMLTYLATAILRISSFSHIIEKKRARDRSLAEPDFGLEEGRDGVLIGLKGVRTGVGEVVVDMEVRRKSGRGVRDVFVLDTSSSTSSSTATATQSPAARTAGMGSGGKTCLLDDHLLYAPPIMVDIEGATTMGGGEWGQTPESTFSLGLTEKQRRDREGVVLPYFDAQRGDGSGEGGRILYEMDRVDDFDEEEDEI
jgi:elongator complex protein 5